MKTATYTHVRANLARSMEQVCKDHAPMIITRQNADPVVLMSLEDFCSIEETSYLLSSPANARRLMESIAEFDA